MHTPLDMRLRPLGWERVLRWHVDHGESLVVLSVQVGFLTRLLTRDWLTAAQVLLLQRSQKSV